MRRIAILYYHRVNEYKSDYNFANVLPQNFREQMQVVSDKYDVISIRDLLEPECFEGDKDAVIITFDDGYRDVLNNVLPIMKIYNYPFTCFITTENIDKGNENWTDIIIRTAFEPNIYHPNCKITLLGKDYCWETDTLDGRNKFYWGLKEVYRIARAAEVQDYLFKQLADWAGIEMSARDSHKILNSGEIEQLYFHGVEIGSHTVTHPFLSDLSDNQIDWCVREAKNKLETIIPEKVICFSYPFGDCPKKVRPILDNNNYKIAATSNRGLIYPETDVMYLPRNPVRNYSGRDFEKYLENEVFK